MRLLLLISAIGLLTMGPAIAQSERDFSGSWKLNVTKSEINNMSVPADPVLKIEQNPKSLVLTASPADGGFARSATYPLDGRTETNKGGGASQSTEAKWEGSALLVNTIVSGAQSYTVMERWRRSRDGNTITIRRTVVRRNGETESTLVYENGQAPPQLAQRDPAPRETQQRASRLRDTQQAEPPPVEQEYVVLSGTRILLRLTNSVNTKRIAVGDRVYLETAAPVFVKGRQIIPRGSFVNGTVKESNRAGKVKGAAGLLLEFDTLTLSNGVARDLKARPSSVDTKGDLDREEGKIKGESSKGRDAGVIAGTAATGTLIGATVGRAAGGAVKGAGIGAAAGAVGGLIGVLATRGADVVLPAGTTMELVVNWDLRFTDGELRGRVQ